jgi:hypothetical protein
MAGRKGGAPPSPGQHAALRWTRGIQKWAGEASKRASARDLIPGLGFQRAEGFPLVGCFGGREVGNRGGDDDDEVAQSGGRWEILGKREIGQTGG